MASFNSRLPNRRKKPRTEPTGSPDEAIGGEFDSGLDSLWPAGGSGGIWDGVTSRADRFPEECPLGIACS